MTLKIIINQLYLLLRDDIFREENITGLEEPGRRLINAAQYKFLQEKNTSFLAYMQIFEEQKRVVMTKMIKESQLDLDIEKFYPLIDENELKTVTSE